MPKTSKPDRRQKGRFRKEPSEFEETTLSVDRVTRVVAGGRRLRFRAVVVVGNKKGKVGLGTGKANEVRSAVEKATAVAKRNMIRIPLKDGTIPHEVNIKHKAARVRILPASEGTGIIAGSAVRVVLEHAGVRNVLSKRYGTTNKLVNAQAVIKALGKLRGEYKEDEPKKEETVKTEGGEHMEVKQVSHDDIKEGNLVVKKEAAKDDKKEEKKPAKVEKKTEKKEDKKDK